MDRSKCYVKEGEHHSKCPMTVVGNEGCRICTNIGASYGSVKCGCEFYVCSACYPMECPALNPKILPRVEVSKMNFDDFLLSEKFKSALEEVQNEIKEKEENRRVVDPFEVEVPYNHFWCPHCGSTGKYEEQGTCEYWIMRYRDGNNRDEGYEDYDTGKYICVDCDEEVDIQNGFNNLKQFILEIIICSEDWSDQWEDKELFEEIKESLEDEEDLEWVAVQLEELDLKPRIIKLIEMHI